MEKKFSLDRRILSFIERESTNYETSRSLSIELLKIVQEEFGWVSEKSISIISDILKVPESDIQEIATFYNFILLRPVGKYVIRYCDSIVCYINGYQRIRKILEKILKIEVGQTSKDKIFTLLPTCCLGRCDKGPSIMINNSFYDRLDSEKMKVILEDLCERKK